MPLDSPCAAAFPRLTEAEMQIVATLGTMRDFVDGDELFRKGDKDFPSSWSRPARSASPRSRPAKSAT